MLDELEAVEISFHYLYKSNNIFRLDSGFYKKEYIYEENLILNKKHNKLTFFATDIKSFGAYSLTNYVKYQKVGIPFLRGLNLKNGIINFQDVIFINKKANELLWKSEVKPKTVLLSMSGTIGDIAFAHEDYTYPINSNQDIAKIRINEKLINSYFIYTFLLTSFGQNQVTREGRGSVQQHIFLSQIEQLLIPLYSTEFQLKIEKLIKSSHQNLQKSIAFYCQSEEILLKELDLLDFESTQENIAIKSFSESFLSTGRIDSEYYQPKYDEIIQKIKEYKGGVGTIEEVCNLKDSNHKPTKDKFYQYIELSNIGRTGDITGCTYNQGQLLPSRARRLVQTNDVIISSIEGSLEKIALVTEEFDNSLCSTGFYVVRSSKINASTLLVLFKNEIMQQILKQNCSGTILTAMNKNEFLNITIPIIDLDIQNIISEKKITSFKLKTESKNLLALAKRVVEIAIEDGEEIALEMINENN